MRHYLSGDNIGQREQQWGVVRWITNRMYIYLWSFVLKEFKQKFQKTKIDKKTEFGSCKYPYGGNINMTNWTLVHRYI